MYGGQTCIKSIGQALSESGLGPIDSEISVPWSLGEGKILFKDGEVDIGLRELRVISRGHDMGNGGLYSS